MDTKTAILIPGTTGLYKGVYQAAKCAAKKKAAMVTTRLSLVEALLRLHSLSKVVIVMGAHGRRKDDRGTGNAINAADAYQTLKAVDVKGFISGKVKIIVMDGWLWKGIPGQILLTGKNTIQAISEQL